MVRFYGISISELDKMPAPRYESFWKAIEVIDNQELLYSMKASILPHQEKAGRKKTLREVETKAFRGFQKPRQEVKSYEDVIANLRKATDGGR